MQSSPKEENQGCGVSVDARMNPEEEKIKLERKREKARIIRHLKSYNDTAKKHPKPSAEDLLKRGLATPDESERSEDEEKTK